MRAVRVAVGEPRRWRVWDLPTRLAHWLLVALFCCSWWTAETGRLDGHRLSGCSILALLLFRVGWGLFGSSSARFAGFLRGPAAVRDYARRLLERPGAESAGHNPMGGWSVMAMLAALLLQAGSGLFAVDTDGIESGPLSHLLSFPAGRSAAAVHGYSFDLLLVLVGLHLAAIAFYVFYKQQNLLRAMLDGMKALPADPRFRFVGWRRALLAALLAAGLVWALVGGPWAA